MLKNGGVGMTTVQEFMQACMQVCGCLHKDNWLVVFSHCLGTVREMGVTRSNSLPELIVKYSYSNRCNSNALLVT